MAADDTQKDDRRWARRITLILVGSLSLLAAPNFLRCVAHSRVDSEVGVMMHGFPLFIGLMYSAPVVGVFTLIWGVGLVRARRRKEAIPTRELLCFGVLAAVIGWVLLALSSNYLRVFFNR